MAAVEPIIVVLGPFGSGTSAVAKVLQDLGVYMGTSFQWRYREPHDALEDEAISLLCRQAFTEPGGQLQMDPAVLKVKFRNWADDHRRAAQDAGGRPGVKHPLLCAAVEVIRHTWGPVVPVVVDRPFDKVMASLNRLGWWTDEQERSEATAHLIAARDRALAGTEVVRVDFEELRSAPAAVIRHLADDLHLDATDAQIRAAVDGIVQAADVAGADPYGIHSLLAKAERNPEDVWPVSVLAEVYFHTGDYANSRKWYQRWIELGGSDDVIFAAKYYIAECMARLDVPWPEVQEAYLRAWEFRPSRAEAVYAIAERCRTDGRFLVGYAFAERAADIPFPDGDVAAVRADVYAWRALDEQAVCASQIGKHTEAFALCRRLLASPATPDDARPRIAGNRDYSVPTMLEAASPYPDATVQRLIAGSGESEVVVSFVAGPGRKITEEALNSFLNCCLDVSRVGRFLAVDAGLSATDRAVLRRRYGFLEFVDRGPGVGLGSQLKKLRTQVHGRFWLHLGLGWRFFAPENYITRLAAVLDAEPQVFQVGINVGDAVELTGSCAPEETVRRAPDAGRYILTDTAAKGPAMFDTTRLERPAGLHTATLDEVLCIAAVQSG